MKLIIVVFTTVTALVVFTTLVVTDDKQLCFSTLQVALESASMPFTCPDNTTTYNCHTVILNELINSSNSDQQLLCGIKKFVFQSGIQVAKDWSRSTFVSSKSTGDQLVIRRQTASTTVICENVPLKISAPTTTIDTLQFQNCKDIRITKKKITATVKIVNSRFTNSCLKFKFEHTVSKDDHTLQVIIRNTTFVKSTCINNGSNSILSFTASGTKDTKFDIILQKVNVSDNNSPLLRLEDDFKAHRLFTCLLYTSDAADE